MIFAKPKNLLKSNVTNRTDNGILLLEMTIQCVPLIKWMFAMIQLTILLVPNVFASSNRIIFCCYACCLVESFRCFYFITVCFDTCNVAALLLFYFIFFSTHKRLFFYYEQQTNFIFVLLFPRLHDFHRQNSDFISCLCLAIVVYYYYIV